jgi:tight adherence protein C
VKAAVVLLFWASAMTALYLVSRRWSTLRRSRERVFEGMEAEAGRAVPALEENEDFLTRWLAKAGYRRPNAAQRFLIATGVGLAFGAAVAYILQTSALLSDAVRLLSMIPGGVGDIFLPFVYLAPWLGLLVFSCAPLIIVRAARRKRVAAVEQDLPITLELLATLGEAGLGFDAALERILQSQPADRPLAQEFRLFQLEILAGRPRAQSLRRLGRRLDVSGFTIFVSALVQADQVGAGTADVLRRQADDLRARRREDALTLAASLPVKLLFPLVICFLPGILVAALGPTLYQVFQFLEGVARSRGL